MNKPEITKHLKALGATNVGIIKNKFCSTTSFKGADGKTMLGFKGGSIGPLTVTNAYQEKNDEVESMVRLEFLKLGLVRDHLISDFMFIANEGTKKEFKVNLSWQLIPTYSISLGLDRDYMTYWLTFSFV
jgi:hypothetical protein